MSDPGLSVVVELEDVTRVYRSSHQVVHALDGVSLTLKAGETLAVIGESGSGKSTLTRLVAGLEQPTSGHVSVAGKAPSIKPGTVATAQVVFQDPAGSLNPHRSIGKSVGEPLQKLRRAQRTGLVVEMLERVGIDPGRRSERPGRFSGGQLQRVAIARAVVARSSVLLCDEPTSALDVSVRAEILPALPRPAGRDQLVAFLRDAPSLAVAQVVADTLRVPQHHTGCARGLRPKLF